MKCFIDTEFLEGPQDKTFLGIKVGKTKPTIDLISIGIVTERIEDKTQFAYLGGISNPYEKKVHPKISREYYAISKDFNLKEAWNRYEWKEHKSTHKEDEGKKLYRKVYWIRENVLKPIWHDLIGMEGFPEEGKSNVYSFTYKEFKKLLNKYGKTNKQIAEEIKEFCLEVPRIQEHGNPKFYAYYADYDWVAFCWLFGKMIDLPKGFPMYCIDLKQTIDYFENNIKLRKQNDSIEPNSIWNTITTYKEHPNYPKHTNEHNALADARWNLELYEFIEKLN
jgi:hypothetical protein